MIAGVLATTRLYSIVPLAIITAALLITNGWRKSLTFTAALVAVFVAVCLPFFVLAPTEMFRMVVLNQIGRGGATDYLVRLRGSGFYSSLFKSEYSLLDPTCS